MKLNKTMIKKVCKGLATAGLAVVMLVSLARLPELHRRILRDKVGAKVYKMTPGDGTFSGGTGFAVKATSGTTYIVTNDHVCKGVGIDGSILVTDVDGKSMKRQIIEESEYTDLCIVEAPPGVEGLTLGSAPDIGDWVYAVGHPALRDNTLTQGEIIETEDISIPEGPMSWINPETGEEEVIDEADGGITEEMCSAPKNTKEYIEIQSFFFSATVKYCFTVTRDAYNTNMQIQGGSSGSPVVNYWGNVIAVVFAGDRMGWGSFVSHKDLVDFLKNH